MESGVSGAEDGLWNGGCLAACQKSPVLPTNHRLNMRQTSYFAHIPVCWSGSKCGDYTFMQLYINLHKIPEVPKSNSVDNIFKQIFPISKC